jgi:hypothetical protein
MQDLLGDDVPVGRPESFEGPPPALQDLPQASLVAYAQRKVSDLKIVEGFKVSGRQDALAANLALQVVKTFQLDLEKARKAELKPLQDKATEINSKYTEPRTILESAENVLKGALLEFRKQEEQRAEAERLLNAAAQAREKAKLEEEARRERERAKVKAAALLHVGKEEQARAVLETAEQSAAAKERVAGMVAAPVTNLAPTKLPGTSFREPWQAEVVDTRAFLRALCESDYDLDQVVSFKQKGLNQLASMLKSRMDEVLPGSISWPNPTLAAGRAK